jgi:hypothetical protein
MLNKKHIIQCKERTNKGHKNRYGDNLGSQELKEFIERMINFGISFFDFRSRLIGSIGERIEERSAEGAEYFGMEESKDNAHFFTEISKQI